MGKTKHIVPAIAIAVAIVLAGAWAFAGGPWGGRGYGGHGYGYGYPYSNLTSEQKEKLQAQQEKFLKGTAELRRELFQKRLELQGLLVDPKADREKVRAKQGEVLDLGRKLQDKALEHRVAIRERVPEGFLGQGQWGWGNGYGPAYGREHMRAPRYGGMEGYGGPLRW